MRIDARAGRVDDLDRLGQRADEADRLGDRLLGLAREAEDQAEVGRDAVLAEERDERIEVPSPERLLGGLEQRVGRAVDRDRDVPVRLAHELCELGRERRRVEVRAPADVLRQPALAEAFEHRNRVALVGQVELVVREEDRHPPDAALARPGHGALDFVQHRVDVAVRVLPPEVRRRAVDALHRAADARPDRKRVRGRVERIAARRPAEAEVVRTNAVGLSSSDQSR